MYMYVVRCTISYQVGTSTSTGSADRSQRTHTYTLESVQCALSSSVAVRVALVGCPPMIDEHLKAGALHNQNKPTLI